jgi:hypothetical protein
MLITKKSEYFYDGILPKIFYTTSMILLYNGILAGASGRNVIASQKVNFFMQFLICVGITLPINSNASQLVIHVYFHNTAIPQKSEKYDLI